MAAGVVAGCDREDGGEVFLDASASEPRSHNIEIQLMIISIIVAYAKNRAIGKNNQLPWHLPADLKHFKTLTMGKPIVMGRKTFESIGKPLPGRRNIVISRTKTFENCENFQSLDDALKTLQAESEIMIIGGATIYAQALPMTNRIYATEVDTVIQEADAFFPEINQRAWKEIAVETHMPDEKNAFGYRFVTFERN